MPELIWDGKYDASGTRVAPFRVALPFQTVETVNESAQERQRSLFFTDGQNTEWRNRLIWGDKKYVLPSLLPDFEDAIDLIYIDPPFATGDNFSLQIELDGDSFTRQANVIEQRAYRDTWSRGLDGYTSWMFETVSLLRDLLSENGVLAIHLDWRMSPVIRLVLDELFGRDSFVNELIWRYGKMSNPSRRFAHSHDQIMVYSKSQQYTFHVQAEGTSEYRNRYERWIGEDNVLRYGAVAASADKLIALRVRKIERQLGRTLSSDDVLFDFNEERKVLDDVFTDISIVKGNSSERTAYPTQKPEALLQRVIGAFSNEGDLVLDCFCGSGTSAVAAEKLNRRWIVCDLGRFAVHTTRKRLLGISDVLPFVVQNLGKYERQLWQESEFGESATARTSAYRSFILDLYHATPVSGYAWLHGLKSGRMVHVGTVDAPVTNGDVKQIVAEFRKAVGTGKDAPSAKGVDLLGWDFAFELNEVARQDAEKAGIDLRLVRIPREVLETRAVEQGDIRFFELAALSVGLTPSARKVTLTLEDFVIPLDDVPADVQKAVTHWSQWIDYWAVDWDNKDDTFHNEWQAYRTRKSKDLSLTTTHEYAEPGDYTVVVKVIDILGNDTTKTLPVKVAGRGA